MFPLPRVLYAIGSDGLIYRFFSRINKRLKTPVIATLLSGFLAACMSAIFDLNQLVNMMSIGTLLAYSLVSISVLILRYQSENSTLERNLNASIAEEENDDPLYKKLLFPSKIATINSSHLVNIITCICIFFIVGICLVLVVFEEKLTQPPVYIPLIMLTLILIVMVVIIGRQPQNQSSVTFKMPLVPYLPLISVFVNFYLMLVLNIQTWIRFGIWMAIGFLIYFSYGITHSSESGEYDRRARLRRARNHETSPLINEILDSDIN